MKISDMSTVTPLIIRYEKLQQFKRYLEQGTKLGINAAPNGIDLQDYPAPSDIGECCRVIRETLRSLLTKQMSDIAKQLRDYGVEP